MPKVRAVDEMNETELRAELVSLLADGVDHADRGFDSDSVPWQHRATSPIGSCRVHQRLSLMRRAISAGALSRIKVR